MKTQETNPLFKTIQQEIANLETSMEELLISELKLDQDNILVKIAYNFSSKINHNCKDLLYVRVFQYNNDEEKINDYSFSFTSHESILMSRIIRVITRVLKGERLERITMDMDCNVSIELIDKLSDNAYLSFEECE